MADEDETLEAAETAATDDGTADTAAPVEATAPAATAAAATAAPVETGSTDQVSRAARKVREGVVVSNKMDKTAVVAVIERVRHPRYAKFVQRTKRLYVHDEDNDVRPGDRVRVMETRPLSKLKRWRIVEVLERAK